MVLEKLALQHTPFIEHTAEGNTEGIVYFCLKRNIPTMRETFEIISFFFNISCQGKMIAKPDNCTIFLLWLFRYVSSAVSSAGYRDKGLVLIPICTPHLIHLWSKWKNHVIQHIVTYRETLLYMLCHINICPVDTNKIVLQICHFHSHKLAIKMLTDEWCQSIRSTPRAKGFITTSNERSRCLWKT